MTTNHRRSSPGTRQASTGVDATRLDTRQLRRLGSDTIELLRRAASVAGQLGARAFLVGGPVRDLILERDTRDLDLVVVGDAIQVAAELARRLRGRKRSHTAFGTATVILHEGLRIDLATARREHYPAPAALPQVEPAELHEDLLRRDFTINSLAVELARGRFGRLVDPTNGFSDIRARRVRVLHSLSFVDDPTRILRAVRFASRLGFDIEPLTRRLLRDALRRSLIRRLSPARLRRELAATLDEPELDRTVSLLQRYGVLESIDPALRADRAALAAVRRLEPLLSRHEPATPSRRPPRWVAVVALLTLEASWRKRHRVLERLQPERGPARLLREARREVGVLRRRLHGGRRRSPGEISVACGGLSDLSVMLVAVTSPWRWVRESLAWYLVRGARVRADISGKDLLAAGVPEGSVIARGLQAALVAKLDGKAPHREAQLEVALRVARRSCPPGSSTLPA